MATLSEFIADIGDERAAVLFGVKPRTAAAWRRGERTPRADQARIIVSRSDGRVSFEAIFAGPSPDAAHEEAAVSDRTPSLRSTDPDRRTCDPDRRNAPTDRRDPDRPQLGEAA